MGLRLKATDRKLDGEENDGSTYRSNKCDVQASNATKTMPVASQGTRVVLMVLQKGISSE